ncbi:MAG: LapA family protein [Candidatus Azosocius agrarius]|nr:MAG: LapA family protein [Gammaproteobacteria bacterium]
MFKLLTIFFSIFLLIFGLVFSSLNSGFVIFNYYIDSIEIPLSLLLICHILLGVLVSVFFLSVSIIKLKICNNNLFKQIKNLKK